jgi:hypothetical protein
MTTWDFITALFHIPPNLVVEHVTAQRKPPEVRIWRFKNQSCVGTLPLVEPGRNTPSLYAVNGRPVYVHLNGLAIVRLK